MTLFARTTLIVLLAAVACSMAGADPRFASEVVYSYYLGPGPYGVANAVLGKPTRHVTEPTDPPLEFAISMVYPAWSPTADSPPVVATLGSFTNPGEIIVEFDPRIEDDPNNWYGLDFIVFGNAVFTYTRTAQLPYITPETDMEACFINNGSVFEEPVTVSVSQDGVDWYTYATPKADTHWPTNAYSWNRTTQSWGEELDWTKPVEPSLTPGDFASKSVADALELYKGSAGGTAFDLAESGYAWIRYIKVTGNGGEIDGFARVSAPLSVARAKLLEDGTPVSLGPQIVTAGTSDMGDCFYIAAPDRSNGIKVSGRAAERNKMVTLSGALATTAGGEREIRATWISEDGDASLKPLGISNRNVGGGDYSRRPEAPTAGQSGVKNGSGLNNIGLLIRTWGKVKSIDPVSGSFTLDDGSGTGLKCVCPAGVNPPAMDSYVKITGISSCEMSGDDLIPVVRVRSEDDLQ